MRPENIYEFDGEITYVACSKKFRVFGYISEYPLGAFNYDEINAK